MENLNKFRPGGERGGNNKYRGGAQITIGGP